MQSKDAKKKSRWGFSFKQLLVVYLLGIVAIVAVAWLWPKYKLNMEEEHNAKAMQLFDPNTTDKDLIELSELTYATELYLGATEISDAGLVHLKSLTNLTILDLRYTKISDAGLVHLKPLTNLTFLDLEGTK